MGDARGLEEDELDVPAGNDAMLAAATRQASMAAQQSASLAEMNASIREIAQTSSAATDHADPPCQDRGSHARQLADPNRSEARSDTRGLETRAR